MLVLLRFSIFEVIAFVYYCMLECKGLQGFYCYALFLEQRIAADNYLNVFFYLFFMDKIHIAQSLKDVNGIRRYGWNESFDFGGPDVFQTFWTDYQ